MSRLVNLTPALLRKIVLEEKAKIVRENAKYSDPIMSGKDDPADVDVPEVDAEDFADTLANKIDYIKALKIKEARLARSLRRIQEEKRRVRNTVIKSLG